MCHCDASLGASLSTSNGKGLPTSRDVKCLLYCSYCMPRHLQNPKDDFMNMFLVVFVSSFDADGVCNCFNGGSFCSCTYAKSGISGAFLAATFQEKTTVILAQHSPMAASKSICNCPPDAQSAVVYRYPFAFPVAHTSLQLQVSSPSYQFPPPSNVDVCQCWCQDHR